MVAPNHLLNLPQLVTEVELKPRSVYGSRSSGVSKIAEPHASTTHWNNVAEFGSPLTTRTEPAYGHANRSASRWGPKGESNTPIVVENIAAKFMWPQGTTQLIDAVHCSP
jgi:hypothetical protein